jgi:hypothetical protein
MRYYPFGTRSDAMLTLKIEETFGLLQIVIFIGGLVLDFRIKLSTWREMTAV